jgi:radical SAM additional 4Fe4S-binding domain
MAFKSLYVSTEGKIVPCCVLAMPETWCMGDLNEEKLEKIWNNKQYRDLRKKIALNQIPQTCINCYRPA